ncbi:MAG: HU family DNA-binding protein [Gemmatimonadales bacterium]
MNKQELIEELAAQVNLAKSEAARVVDALFGGDGVIVQALRKNDKVQITGFGVFQTRERAAREGRNPRTGEAVKIAAAKVPTFRAGQALKDAINR